MKTDLDVGSWTESGWTESGESKSDESKSDESKSHKSKSHKNKSHKSKSAESMSGGGESRESESAQALHARVVRYCHDSLTRALVELHRPQVEPGADPELPTCHGCARYDAGDAPAPWPCRPYGLIASKVLPDVVLVDESQNA